MGLELANLLFAGRTGVLHIIEGVDATWYAGTAPKTESTVSEIILICWETTRLDGLD